MQERLNQISREDETLPSLVVDGIFGPATQQAVLTLQRQLGFDPTGAVGPVLWSHQRLCRYALMDSRNLTLGRQRDHRARRIVSQQRARPEGANGRGFVGVPEEALGEAVGLALVGHAEGQDPAQHLVAAARGCISVPETLS